MAQNIIKNAGPTAVAPVAGEEPVVVIAHQSGTYPDQYGYVRYRNVGESFRLNKNEDFTAVWMKRAKPGEVLAPPVELSAPQTTGMARGRPVVQFAPL